jgi:hypothetical protein
MRPCQSGINQRDPTINPSHKNKGEDYSGNPMLIVISTDYNYQVTDPQDYDHRPFPDI